MVIDDTCLLADELAGVEDREVGDAAYSKPRSELLVFVRIDFEDDGGTWSRTVANQQVLTRQITDNLTLIHISPTS